MHPQMHYRATKPTRHFSGTHNYHDLPRCGQRVYLRGILRFYPGDGAWESSACFQKLESYRKDIRDRLADALFGEP
jgi:hypothetical protein